MHRKLWPELVSCLQQLHQLQICLAIKAHHELESDSIIMITVSIVLVIVIVIVITIIITIVIAIITVKNKG